ncbi:peptidoglycan-binding protein [Alkalihalobacillus trypoxylicola]|uniref:Peptidase n=1 Tax=Alkalihalobacillus trypoxylicola TaxID=519424 RepID=A0A161PDV8_9BACI|nr:peptidoglycan-binding protein [Alkalihalobacillus trypoxylicola]KYG30604.1 peptidase [Alkalihalobacillus trypoxylicola]
MVVKKQSSMKRVFVSSTVATGIVLSTPLITEAALGDQTLRQGMSHSDVVELQDVLTEKGFFTYKESTGYFGVITVDAVKDFQRKNNLTADGIVGPKTFSALGAKSSNSNSNNSSSSSNSSNNSSQNVSSNVASNSILRNGSRGGAVTTLQNQLSSQGYYKISIDGIYGNGTAQAVRNFQKDHNLTVDGIAGPQTMNALANKVGGNSSNSGSSNSNSGSSNSNSGSSSNSNSSSSNSSILRVGVSGQAVTNLQSQLRSVGVFNQEPTGYYGKDTESAVRSFQRTHGLTADGIAGPKTFAKLNEVSTNQGDKEQTSGGNSSAGSNNSAGALVTNLIAEASLYIGVPYVWGGTSTAGFDCSGFIQYVFKQQGINLPRTVATQWNAGTSVSKPSVGDIVFFQTISDGPSHNGIYIGNNQFIHSGSSTGVTITSMDNSYWKPRYLGAKRLH